MRKSKFTESQIVDTLKAAEQVFPSESPHAFDEQRAEFTGIAPSFRKISAVCNSHNAAAFQPSRSIH